MRWISYFTSSMILAALSASALVSDADQGQAA
jgi:hypothetical protein